MSLLGNNPCQDINEIKELSSGDRTINYNSSTDKCDLRDSAIGNDWSKWYKITGNAGNALRVNTPPRKTCGGKVQVYLTENHPVPSDGVVNLQLCIQNPSELCYRKKQISVVNCGSFYLYQLQRIRNNCNLTWRYCTNGKGKHLPIKCNHNHNDDLDHNHDVVSLLRISDIPYKCRDNARVPCEQRLHFRCVSWRANSSLCLQPFNFLSCMREIRHAIPKQN